MNKLFFADGAGHFADLSVICRQAKSITIKCAGQEFTDLVVTEEGGHVVVMANAPTPWPTPDAPIPHDEHWENITRVREEKERKRRGRPPKARLEGDTTK